MSGPVSGDLAAARSGEGLTLETLRHRRDFLAASRERKASRPAFSLQARRRNAGEPPDVVRIGFTCSRKVGNAVARNRAKRRLRALAREVLPGAARPGWDYVLIGRPAETASRPFEAMIRDLLGALENVHHREDRP